MMNLKQQLTRKNYHTLESNNEYLSVSQYKDFLSCEARTIARLKGEWTQYKSKDALLYGSMLHSWNEGKKEFEEFISNHPDLISTRGKSKGQLKSQYSNINELVERLESDSLVLKALAGEKEKIFTAELFGIQWKICIDSYDPDKNKFADLKTMQDLYSKYYDHNVEAYVDFIKYYKYDLQMAVYTEVEKIATGRDKNLNPIIVAITKESPPDVAIFKGFLEYKDFLLDEVEQNIPRIIDLKAGLKEPKLCNRCDYCRSVKKTPVIEFHNFTKRV
jgi:hypothetical protein